MKGAWAALAAIATLGVALGLGAMSGRQLAGRPAEAAEDGAATTASPAAGTVALPAGSLQADRCVECHATTTLHACSDCHDVHGDATLAGLPRTATLSVVGDVAHPAHLPVAQLVQRGPGDAAAALPLLTLLDEQGAGDWASVTLRAPDGNEVTVAREDLPDDATLTPWIDGVRLATDALHVSSWVKGIDEIVVVGRATPLTVGGEPTSIGRLLAGPTRAVTAEPAEVRLAARDGGGAPRVAVTSTRLEGAPLGALVDGACTRGLVIRTLHGDERTLEPADACGAVLAQQQGNTTVVLDGRARPTWIEWVVAVDAR